VCSSDLMKQPLYEYNCNNTKYLIILATYIYNVYYTYNILFI
jgi:hypothetical protein